MHKSTLNNPGDKKTSYIGHHRENLLPKGVGLIPLGDRDRVSPNAIHLVGNAEEVDSVDQYSKYV